MSNDIFDVQAALLFDREPSIDFEVLAKDLSDRAFAHGIAGPFRILPGATSSNHLALAGQGLHATISLIAQPLQPEAFAVALKSPVLKIKKFDTQGAIDTHTFGIVINVGDGEVPMAPDLRQQMAAMGVGGGCDPELKLTVLHLLTQAIASVRAPLLTHWVPTDQLISPIELESVADFGLPIPLLFHPYPTNDGKDDNGRQLIGMEALQSHRLIGKDLKVEAVPPGVPIATSLNLLSTLIIEKRKGNLPLDHGDVLDEENGPSLYIRHEAPQGPGRSMRIVASFSTPASGPAPEMPQPSPQAPVDASPEGQQVFQDRVNKLKAKAKPLPDVDVNSIRLPMADEFAADQQAEVPDTPPARFGIPINSSTIRFGAIACFLVGIYVFNPASIIENKMSAKLDAAQPFGTPTNMMATSASVPMKAAIIDEAPAPQTLKKSEIEATIAALRAQAAAQRAERAAETLAESGSVDEKPTGKLIISAPRQNSDESRAVGQNVLVYEMKDDAEREEITERILQSLRSPNRMGE